MVLTRSLPPLELSAPGGGSLLCSQMYSVTMWWVLKRYLPFAWEMGEVRVWGVGVSTSLNWGWAASRTSCRMSPSLVERKAPLWCIRDSATSRSTWLRGAGGGGVCMRCQRLGLDTQTPGKLGRDPAPWFFLGAPNPSHMHPTPEGTLSPAGGAGVHHHVDLQPLVQEVQGCVLGAERGQDYPWTRTVIGEPGWG